MDILDITFDMETTALCPSAGVLAMAAVAWNREALKSPWLYRGDASPETFFKHVNGNSNFVECRTHDADTMEWWHRQPQEVKDALLPEDPYTNPPLSLRDLLLNFFEWIEQLRTIYEPKAICLWCQGSDFDIAILRDIAYKLDEMKALNDSIVYTNHRDCRTYVLENGREFLKCSGEEDIRPCKIYALIPSIECDFAEKQPHDPLFDSVRSTWSVWNIMKRMNEVFKSYTPK